jgi:hypothetical protein
VKPIDKRFRQIMLMLSSDKPGEVAAAAAAVTRHLQSIGATWHDLVDLVVAKAEQSGGRDSSGDWRAMREECLRHRDRLREREAEFLDSIGAWRGDLTEKQHGWLAAIHARLCR